MVYDNIDEITSRNNQFYQVWKYLAKNFNISKYDNPFKIFQGLPFYRFDLDAKEHLKLYDQNKSRCCFNHFIGLPEKDNKRMPLFPYEKLLFDDFMHSWRDEPFPDDGKKYRFFAVLKATGLGITEFCIRLMAWLAVSTDQFKGKRFGIIAGIREEIVLEILRRFVALFDRFPFLNIRLTKKTMDLNGVIIEGYPAENVLALRSYANFAFILVDEGDFFQKSLQKEVRTGVERYIAKSNPFVWFVSTPDKPNGMFYEIFSKPQKETFYRQYRLDYTYGLGYIFTKDQIKQQKLSEFFGREYELQFGGLAGNLFSTRAIQRNIVTDQQARELEFFPYYFHKDIDFIHDPVYIPRSLGIDPGFGSNPAHDVGSYTGLCLTQYRNNRAEVLYAEELIQPDFDELVRIAAMIIAKTNCTKVYVDGSNPAVIKSLKNAINENPDYSKLAKDDLESRITRGSMIVCPVNFNTRNKKEMLYYTKDVIDKGLVVIHERQTNVIDFLKSAYVEEGKLDKEKTARDDLGDALQLSLKNYTPDLKLNVRSP